MIIDESNVDMSVWRRIGDSNILIINPFINTLVNQLLTMCEVVGENVDKWGVNLTTQFSSILVSFVSCV